MANILFDPERIAQKRFGGPGGTTQPSTPEQLAAKQAVLVRGSTPTERSVDLSTLQTTPASSTPPKANAAPSVNKNIVHGLMDNLNKKEAELVKDGVFEVACKYSVEFAPAALGDARVTKFGKPLKSKVPMQQSKNPSDKVNPDSNSADYAVRTQAFDAGTPILVIIDEILKNSTYIADQAKYINDEVTKEVKPQKPLGNLVWYKISVGALPIEPFDKKRNAYAQDIKYVISAYPINSMVSEYFPECNVRGRHKSYKYWFTGENTQVLSFAQKFNSLYQQTFTNPKILAEERQAAQTLISPPREFQSAVASSNTQGAEAQANAPGASAADWLYNKSDLSTCEITIVGDPAWLQQGELAHSLNASSFNFSPFNPDGTINYDAQEIIFDLQWSPGVDYDLTGTGLAQPTVSGNHQAVWTYKATQVVSKFSRGKFTQNLTGTFVTLVDLTTKPVVATAVQADAQRASAADIRRIDNAIDAGVRPATLQRSPEFSNTGGGAATGNPLIAQGTQPGNPRINPGSLRDVAAQANAARETLANPPQSINPTAEQVESTPAYQAALAAGASPALAAAVSQQSLGANGAGVSTAPIESTVAYQNAIAAGATPQEAVIIAQRSIGAGSDTPVQKINRET